ncbi:hypothetical protein BKA70DRAFT_1232263 [Coprinopsis sp. MPI-PUGE-AT-0042]|nr:hypothetical protein BKA70DRAFT_1232263 [Coprinopsis sp. MPI-PUGE-AT-0042]
MSPTRLTTHSSLSTSGRGSGYSHFQTCCRPNPSPPTPKGLLQIGESFARACQTAHDAIFSQPRKQTARPITSGTGWALVEASNSRIIVVGLVRRLSLMSNTEAPWDALLINYQDIKTAKGDGFRRQCFFKDHRHHTVLSENMPQTDMAGAILNVY